jgi:hypothetical protein
VPLSFEEVFKVCHEVYQVCGESADLRAKEYRAEFERAVCQVFAREKEDWRLKAFQLIHFKAQSYRWASKALGIPRSTLVSEIAKENSLVGMVLQSKGLYPPSDFF